MMALRVSNHRKSMKLDALTAKCDFEHNMKSSVSTINDL
jgi:hypothetical protein